MLQWLNKYKWPIVIGAIVASFFLGRCSRVVEKETVEVPVTITVPGKYVDGPITHNPKPLPKTDSKKGLREDKEGNIVSDHEEDKELAAMMTDLKTDRDRLLLLLGEAQIESYSVPYEDDRMTMSTDITSRGKLLKYQPHITYKDIKVDTTLAVSVPKEKVKLFLGGGVSGTKALDKFDVEAKAAIQFKNGDVLIGGYGTNNTGSITYLKKI